jgi:hypothetical protein
MTDSWLSSPSFRTSKTLKPSVAFSYKGSKNILSSKSIVCLKKYIVGVFRISSLVISSK